MPTWSAPPPTRIDHLSREERGVPLFPGAGDDLPRRLAVNSSQVSLRFSSAAVGHFALREHQSLAIALHSLETGEVILLLRLHRLN
jgi:hypothetical protein